MHMASLQRVQSQLSRRMNSRIGASMVSRLVVKGHALISILDLAHHPLHRFIFPLFTTLRTGTHPSGVFTFE